MHNMTEVSIGWIPGKHGSKGTLCRVRWRCSRRSSSWCSLHSGRLLGLWNSMVSKIVWHTMTYTNRSFRQLVTCKPIANSKSNFRQIATLCFMKISISSTVQGLTEAYQWKNRLTIENLGYWLFGSKSPWTLTYTVVPFSELGNPGIWWLEVQVELFRRPILLHEKLILRSQKPHVLFKYGVASLVNEPRRDSPKIAWETDAAKPCNQHAFALTWGEPAGSYRWAVSFSQIANLKSKFRPIVVLHFIKFSISSKSTKNNQSIWMKNQLIIKNIWCKSTTEAYQWKTE